MDIISNEFENIKKIVEIIKKLNEEIYDAELESIDEIGPVFEFKTNGALIIIKFMSVRLWFSDDDERVFDDEYEPLEPYLRREAQKIINQIGGIKL